MIVRAALPLLLFVPADVPGQTGLRPVAQYVDYIADWSPDGTRIAFSSTRAAPTARSIFVVDVATGAITQLTTNTVAPGDSYAAWSPDGRSIAFTSNRAGNQDVFVMAADGTGIRNLTNDSADDGGMIDWSPDGTRIVFASNRARNYSLYTMQRDGTDVRQLTRLTGNASEPSWSPDGSRIAFAWDRDGNWELYSIAADGSDLRRLTSHWGWEGHPTWSPDGKRIAFWSDRDDFWFDIYVMDADGQNVQRLTRSPDWDLDPAWSPDGTRIAWHSAGGQYGIEIMNADGTGRRRITSDASSDFAQLVRRAGVDSAIAAHARAKKAQPDSSFIHGGEIWQLGAELLAAGDTAGAIRLHEFHLTLNPSPSIYEFEGLGRAYRAAGRPAPPGFAEFFALIRSHGVTHARGVLDAVRQRFPNWQIFSEFRMNRLGYEYLHRGWAQEAAGLFEMNVTMYPRSANAYDSLGEAYWRAGDAQRAMAAYERAVALDPGGATAANATRMLSVIRAGRSGKQ